VVESSVGLSGCHHSTPYTPESVDLSTSSPHHAQPAPVIVDEICSDVDDGHRLTAVYVQSRKTTCNQDDIVSQCPSPASSSNRGSPSRSHHRHRQTPAVSRTLPYVIGNGDVVGAAAARQRVSFQVHAEPRSQSSTCIAAADTRPTCRRTDADQHRTSSVDDMRTFHAPERSPKPPRHDARPAVDVAANGAANSAPHDIKTALDEITSSSGQQTDSVD